MTERQSARLFIAVLIVTLLIKAALATALPITGDEAYFVIWGRHPALGYYDHPPMVGWWLYLLLHLGGSAFVVRLPAILLSTFIGLVIFRVLRQTDRSRAFLVGTLWLLLPLNVVNVLTTTDTPLILFTFLSGIWLFRALATERARDYGLAGVALGLAFLSKYFAVLLGVAYLAYFLAQRRDRRGLRGLGIVVLCALPFGLLNLYWNYTHCWDNILFNAVNRTQHLPFSPSRFLAYAGMLVYVITPPLLIYLVRNRRRLRPDAADDGRSRLFVFLALVPLLLFAVISFKKVIGLHWLLAFLPFLMFVLHRLLDESQLLSGIKFMAVFSLAHVLVIGVALAMPLSTWQKTSFSRSIVLGTRAERIIERLDAYPGEFRLATNSYAKSAILSFYSGRHVMVFGTGSYHARQDDILTDFRRLAGDNILILTKTEQQARHYAQYFARARLDTLTQDGATFHIVLGYNFEYAKYRDSILRQIRAAYYRIPDFLPFASCYFCDRYFPEPE